jgi:peptidoglycan/LPS O-acetylase OafA/YrhL
MVAVPAEAPETGAPLWRLGRRPALDGLRAVAVTLVVLAHIAGVGRWDALGKTGVGVFFVLSGFLITSLLVDGYESAGRIEVRRFYARRVRRLAPAMLCCVAVTCVVGVVLPGFVSWPMVAGSLTYSANWVKIGSADGGAALGHLWSLAVEEQFYLVWPFVLLLLLRLRTELRNRIVLLLTVAASLLPFLLIATGSSTDRVLYGSDTRSMPLLAGCLLALELRLRPERRVPAALAVASLAGIVALSCFGTYRYLVVALPQVVALLTCAVIYQAVQATPAALLNDRWLRLLGRRSYAVYLWQLPLLFASRRLVGEPHLAVTAFLLALALATGASWRFVEEPFLRRRELPNRPLARARAPREVVG